MNTTPSIWNGVPSITCRPRGNTHSAPIVSNGDGPVKDLRSSVWSGSARTASARPRLAANRHERRRIPGGKILLERMVRVSALVVSYTIRSDGCHRGIVQRGSEWIGVWNLEFGISPAGCYEHAE